MDPRVARHRHRMKDPEYAVRYRERARKRKYDRRYGISYEVYEEMVAAQGGRCLICRRKKRLQVDHDHTSGVVRGLLCGSCNKGLGSFKDDVRALKRAINYLMEVRDGTDDYVC